MTAGLPTVALRRPHVSAMFLHLVGAATWVGVMLALAAVRATGGLRGPALADAISRFSPVAAWCLVIVGYSGVASAVVPVLVLGVVAYVVGDLLGTL